MNISVLIPFVSKPYSNNFRIQSLMLEQTIRSLENTAYSDLDIFVVSNDEPECNLHSANYLKTDIHIVRAERPGSYFVDKELKIIFGLSHITKIQSDFLFICDGDDFVHKDVFEYIQRNSKADIISMKYGYIYDSNNTTYRPSTNYYRACGSSTILKIKKFPLPTNFSNIDRMPHPLILEKYWIIGGHKQNPEQFAKENGLIFKIFPFFSGLYRMWPNSQTAQEKAAGKVGLVRRNSYKFLSRSVSRRLERKFGMDLDREKQIRELFTL